MRVLVTGGTGFIGRYLCEALIREGHSVIALARKTSRVSVLLQNARLRLVYGDILDYDSLFEVIPDGLDICFHCAACVESTSYKRLHPTNVIGTRNIFEACRNKGIKKIVHVSSVAVVSGHEDVPLEEGLSYAATNNYGRTKIEAEKIAIQYRDTGMKVAIFRPCVVYGEGEPHLLPLIVRLLRLRLFCLLGKAGYKWHMGYVRNVVDALLLTLVREQAYSGTYFVADKEVLTVRDVFNAIADGLGVPRPWSMPEWLIPMIRKFPYWGQKASFLTKDRVYDLNRIQTELGYNPKYSARDALQRTGAYYSHSPNRYIAGPL